MKSKLDKQVWERWITIDNYRNYPALSNILTDFAGNNILGFVYIDHTSGTTLDVVKLFNRVGDKIEFVDTTLTKDKRIIIRHSQFSEINYQVVDDHFIEDHELVKPYYLKNYDRDDLIDFRKNEIFDVYRADGFPDDIQILLLITDDNEIDPELVWGRVEEYNNSDNTGKCQLLVQPHQNFGVNINDTLAFSLAEIDTKIWAVGIMEDTKVKKVTKPWWKVW